MKYLFYTFEVLINKEKEIVSNYLANFVTIRSNTTVTVPLYIELTILKTSHAWNYNK